MALLLPVKTVWYIYSPIDGGHSPPGRRMHEVNQLLVVAWSGYISQWMLRKRSPLYGYARLVAILTFDRQVSL